MDELDYQFLSVFIAMAIPLLFIAFMCVDKQNRKIILYFCWGLFAGLLSYNLNNAIGNHLHQADRMSMSISPIVEEICKGLPLLVSVLLHKQKKQNIRFVVMCAFASGVAFSIQESIFYFSESSRELIYLWLLFVRTFTTSLMHGLTTAAFFIGMMVTYRQKDMVLPIAFGLLALCASIHALFNLLLQTNFSFIAMLMPITIFIFGHFVMQRENLNKRSE